MHPFDALAVLLILAIFCAGIIATFTRKPRHDASAERANADRRSLSGGAAKPLFHSTLIATGAQRDGE